MALEHVTSDCTANRIFADFGNLGIEDVSGEEAWAKLQKADEEKDIDDIKKASLISKSWSCASAITDTLTGYPRIRQGGAHHRFRTARGRVP